jgi:hypothetical protein
VPSGNGQGIGLRVANRRIAATGSERDDRNQDRPGHVHERRVLLISDEGAVHAGVELRVDSSIPGVFGAAASKSK